VSRPTGNLAAAVADDETFIVRVEIPKGSRNKYEYDEELDAIKLDRFLFSSMVYPTDYGYFPEAMGEDGDPLDAMVCVSEATFPGCVIEVNPIALFKMEDDGKVDDKILCVPTQDPAWNGLHELDDLPDQLKDEIEHFFSVYKDLEQKKVKVEGWFSRSDAIEVIEKARERQSSGDDDGEPDRDGDEEPENTESG
jgi:inorganic pyrophosphatase